MALPGIRILRSHSMYRHRLASAHHHHSKSRRNERGRATPIMQMKCSYHVIWLTGMGWGRGVVYVRFCYFASDSPLVTHIPTCPKNRWPVSWWLYIATSRVYSASQSRDEIVYMEFLKFSWIWHSRLTHGFGFVDSVFILILFWWNLKTCSLSPVNMHQTVCNLWMLNHRCGDWGWRNLFSLASPISFLSIHHQLIYPCKWWQYALHILLSCSGI